MQTITTLAELDSKLDAASEAAKSSPSEFRKALDGFVLDPLKLIGRFTDNPGSESYRARQMELYKVLADRNYQTDNEGTPFDHEQMMRWPFPYSTRSASLVGEYLMTYGNLIKTMNLDQGARILEIGSGFGPLTYQLASMGYNVTCVDVHEPLLDYVRERTRNLPGGVSTIHADMNDLSLHGSFDAIIFFESFHHSADHIGMLERLPRLLEPNGALILAGEPIVPKGSLAVPYPWGLRLDGLSLWFIRRHGWLELGFEESYLRSLLEESGWSVVCMPNHATPTMGIWMARRTREDSWFAQPFEDAEIASWNASDMSLQTLVGKRAEDGSAISSTGKAGYLVFGPYVALDPGFYEVQWEGAGSASIANGRVDVACECGSRILGTAEFSVGKKVDRRATRVLAHLRFSIDAPVADLEFRMHVNADSALHLSRIVLRRR
jgi:2-polyprenyl-3-methyl-5-hydroxy-6-metoxy-1,4-benzoquinol methylase